MYKKFSLLLLVLSYSLLSSSWSVGLVYSTFLGGISEDIGQDIALDSNGNAYIVGYTLNQDFPTTGGAYDTTRSSGYDVVIAKLNSTGSSLLYSTYLGGSGDDFNSFIAIDSAGNAYLAGHTESSDFPVTPGAFDSTYHVNTNIYVTKLNATGTNLVYSTILGGLGLTICKRIAVDKSGNAFVTGGTMAPDFPTTPGAYDTTYSGGPYDIFISKFNPTGTALVYSTLLGGVGLDIPSGISVDSVGNAIITGFTNSTEYPVTPQAYDTVFHAGGYDGMVTKINATGTALIYSTFLGGTGDDGGTNITQDESGNAYIIGITSSSDFPTTPNTLDTTYNGLYDTFVSKLDPTGSSLLYSTYLGGSGEDAGRGISMDSSGIVYLSGYTQSPDFPTTPKAFDTTYHGNIDVFVSKLDTINSTLLYSSFLGGSQSDGCYTIANDKYGNAYLTGYTNSSEFPVTPGAYDTSFNGTIFSGSDIFITKLSTIILPPPDIKSLPALKLFLNQGLNPALDLADYNPDASANTFSMLSNFLSLSTLIGSTVYQADYSSSTTGINTYEFDNGYETSTTSHKIKYSTYKIKRLPQVVLRPNRSWDVNVGNYTIDSSNALVIPPSFNNSDSLIVSDSTQLYATWSNPSTVTITALAGFNSAQEVDVIASPQSNAPYGSDIDKERIEIYPSLSTTAFEFTNSSDINSLSYQIPAGGAYLPSLSYSTGVNDSAGNSSHGGVFQINYDNLTSSVKLTPVFSSWLPNTPQSWYTMRVRVCGTNVGNNYLQLFFNGVPGRTPTDIQGYFSFSMPTIWTYYDVPINVYSSVSNKPVMYPQLVLKSNNTTGTVYIDEIEIFQAIPPLFNSRANTADHYTGGYWNDISDTTHWVIFPFYSWTANPVVNVSNGKLLVTISGDTGTQNGYKFTASTSSGTVYTISSSGHQLGMHLQSQLISGNTNLYYTQIQMNMIGASGLAIAGDIAAASELGRVSPRTLQLAFTPNNDKYMVQFVYKNSGTSTIQIDNTQADIDNDDPNDGDSNLFP